MVSQKINGFERQVYFRPAWHKVNDDTKKDYGVHGMEIRFVLIGPLGAIHFINYTGMMLEETYDWWKATGRNLTPHKMHMGVDVGYHSPTPQFDGQEVMWPKKRIEKVEGLVYDKEKPMEYFDNITWEKIGDEPPICEYIGVPCYTDGSAIRGDDWHNIWLKEGDDKIWEMMEEAYKDNFN